MILPIVGYGHPVLRKMCEDITPDYPELEKLIADMWETMYNSNGVGLAAPQINKPIRMFMVDTEQMIDGFDAEDKRQFPNEKGIKKTFINAHIIEEDGEPWVYNEGCLSIPKIREDVSRYEKVTLSYCDENFKEVEETFSGLTARVILHEYDHIDGKLFVDYLKPLKKRLLKKKLHEISVGKVRVDYRMMFAK